VRKLLTKDGKLTDAYRRQHGVIDAIRLVISADPRLGGGAPPTPAAAHVADTPLGASSDEDGAFVLAESKSSKARLRRQRAAARHETEALAAAAATAERDKRRAGRGHDSEAATQVKALAETMRSCFTHPNAEPQVSATSCAFCIGKAKCYNGSTPAQASKHSASHCPILYNWLFGTDSHGTDHQLLANNQALHKTFARVRKNE
jgi:hypothetical protein